MAAPAKSKAKATTVKPANKGKVAPAAAADTTPGDTAPEAANPAAAQVARNRTLAFGLVAFVALVFVITVVRLQGDAINRWNYQAPTESAR